MPSWHGLWLAALNRCGWAQPRETLCGSRPPPAPLGHAPPSAEPRFLQACDRLWCVASRPGLCQAKKDLPTLAWGNPFDVCKRFGGTSPRFGLPLTATSRVHALGHGRGHGSSPADFNHWCEAMHIPTRQLRTIRRPRSAFVILLGATIPGLVSCASDTSNGGGSTTAASTTSEMPPTSGAASGATGPGNTPPEAPPMAQTSNEATASEPAPSAASNPPDVSSGATGDTGATSAPEPVSTDDVLTTTGEAAGGEPMVMGDAFTVNPAQLASEVDPKAPTTVGIVTWSTTIANVTEAHLEFGLTTDYGMTAPVDLTAEGYRTLLLGMKPAKTYHFRVVVSDGTSSKASSDYTLDTLAMTTQIEIDSFEVLDEAAREPGFTVASYWSGTDSSVAYILDKDGEIVWAYDTGITGGIARASISDDGKNLWVISASNSGTTLSRVGMDGLGAETYAATVGSHDITPVSGSKMAFIEYGESDCNSIFEIDPSGTTKEVWDSQDVQAEGGGRCHGNALRYSATEGVYTFSDVSTDIFQLSAEGQLGWKLTEKVPEGNAAWDGVQHGHHLLEDSILIFSNGGSKTTSGASAAIEYALADGSELWRYEGAAGEKSQNLGDVQRLPGGNTLVTFSNDSIVHEVTPDKKVVVKWKGMLGTRLGYSEWRPDLYGPSPLVHD